EITALNGREGIFFEDIRPTVSSTDRGDKVDLVVSYRGKQESLAVEPLRQEDAAYPMLGIAPPNQPVLAHFRRDTTPPYRVGSPAAAATGGGFLPGDRIVAMSEPADPTSVTPLAPNWNGLPGEVFDYERRLAALAGRPVTFGVVRRPEEGRPDPPPVAVTVPPGYRKDLGLRMQMGQVAA